VVSNRLRQHGQKSQDKFHAKWKKQQDDPRIFLKPNAAAQPRLKAGAQRRL
jgi:hypothetical protein